MSIQTSMSKAEIITFKNGLSINTSRPFDQEMEKTMNTIGPEKAKELVQDCQQYFSKMRPRLMIV